MPQITGPQRENVEDWEEGRLTKTGPQRENVEDKRAMQTGDRAREASRHKITQTISSREINQNVGIVSQIQMKPKFLLD